MKQIKTLFGNYVTEMELCDFSIGDNVRYNGKGNAPKYLAEYTDLFVEKINKKSVRITSKSFPNEYWNVAPVYLKLVEKNRNNS